MAFQRDLEEFEKWDTQVVGVSTDSLEDNKEFAGKNHIRFPLVSDKDKTIKKRYGSGRVTYLIDKKGIIRFKQKGVPDNRAFIDALKAMP
nr:redoxin domain-containing protein [Desulfobacula sp.]